MSPEPDRSIGIEAPYKPFPFKDYKITKKDGHPVIEYISPEEFTRIVDDISSQINLDSYQNIIVNDKGGNVLCDMLRERQAFRGEIFHVSYHRPKDGIGVDIIEPIPGRIYNQKNLIVEDIWDRGDTLLVMLTDAGPNTEVAVLFKKRGIKDQKELKGHRVILGRAIDKVWVGGGGMNLDTGEGDVYPLEFLRYERGLWVRPDSLVNLDLIFANIPYIPYDPDKLRPVKVGKNIMFEYISPEQMDKYIRALADKFNFEDYERVIVNLMSGEYLFRKLAEIKGYKKKPAYVEYHGSPGGFGARVKTSIPKELEGKKCLVIDDSLLTGGVLEEILDPLSSDSLAVVALTKRGIEGQITRPNILIGAVIDNVRTGGYGSKLEMNDEETRSFGGVVTRFPELPR